MVSRADECIPFGRVCGWLHCFGGIGTLATRHIQEARRSFRVVHDFISSRWFVLQWFVELFDIWALL